MPRDSWRGLIICNTYKIYTNFIHLFSCTHGLCIIRSAKLNTVNITQQVTIDSPISEQCEPLFFRHNELVEAVKGDTPWQDQQP